jgi:site-specific recombinase XerD
MDAFSLISSTAAAALKSSSFNRFVPSYWERLDGQGYSQSTTRDYLSCIAHFARWCDEEGRPVQELDQTDLVQFLGAHLPICNCPMPFHRSEHQLRAAIRHFLAILKQSRFVDPIALSPAKAELLRFDAYLKKTKGLAASTRAKHLTIVGELLNQQVDQTILPTLNPQLLRQCLHAQRSRLSPSSAGGVASALRGYIKYRLTVGDAVAHLLPIIASPANWRLAPLPQTLNPAQVNQLLSSFGPGLPSARRGYAIIRCLVDLGLRVSEVATIELDDIDWYSATLHITKAKSRRTDVLPLPTPTIKAIADYIQFERPTTTLRRVFIRHVAPVDRPITSAVIRNTVRNAYLRCDLPFTRVHILRHTLAGRILASGGTLKEVADVLRHRHLDTSLIYTKIDFARLSVVAQPWPGSTV